MAVFTPQMFQNLPAPVAPPVPAMDPGMVEPVQPIIPQAPPPPPPPVPVFIPVPIQVKPQPARPKGVQISPEAARKAQGIYPKESAEKQQMIDNAKAPPTPTGAWGAPE